MLKKKTKRSIYKRSLIFFKNKNFRVKLSHSNKNHLLLNKNGFSKNNLKSKFFFISSKILKKILF